MATVLVTGGTGLIGANICRRLCERGDDVRALVRPALAHRRFPEPYFTDALTRERLGHRPIRLDEALRRTLTWLAHTHR